jgi:hypothetical protein
MAGGVERQIFEDAGRDESQAEPFPAPDATDDQAVTDAIRSLHRTPDAPPPARPAAPRQPPPQQPAREPGLDDVDETSASGLRSALTQERNRRREYETQLQRYQEAERERAAREGRPPISERLFTDPERTLEELRQEWTQPLQQTIATMQLNQDFSAAEARHGPERFQTAFQAWYAAVEGGQDAISYFSVMNAPSPGDAVMRWYRMREFDEQVGDGDLEAYRQRVIAEAMQGRGPAPVRDPETGRFTGRPQAPQRLPTATSRLGASNRHRDEDDENDGSEAAIFAAARPSRRGER